MVVHTRRVLWSRLHSLLTNNCNLEKPLLTRNCLLMFCKALLMKCGWVAAWAWGVSAFWFLRRWLTLPRHCHYLLVAKRDICSAREVLVPFTSPVSAKFHSIHDCSKQSQVHTSQP